MQNIGVLVCVSLCVCAHVSARTCAIAKSVCGKVGLHESKMVFECGGDWKGTCICEDVCVHSLCVCLS